MNFRWASLILGTALLTTNYGCEKAETLPDTLVYGHAGTTLYPGRWVYPPNTAESVIYALDVLGAEGVEVDVQMTRDSVLVLYHDPYLDDNTHLSGCIPRYDYADLENQDIYQTRFKLARLDEVLEICINRGKKLFLDLKPYHYCDSVNISFQTFDNALSKVLADYSPEQLSDLVVNARSMDLLNALSDTSIILSLETENIALALEKFKAGQIDEACFNLSALTDEAVGDLNDAGLNFCIFGMKTHSEIKRALLFEPLRVITDNIAYTQKQTR